MVTFVENKRVLDTWDLKENGRVPFDHLLGKTITCVEVLENAEVEEDTVDIGDGEDCAYFELTRDVGKRNVMVFTLSDGEELLFYHKQSCCEDVRIEDIVGDLEDLIGTPILLAEDVYHKGKPSSAVKEAYYASEFDGPAPPASFTWTFYKLGTIKGYVDIRWFGVSNGYYSETADLVRLKHPN